MLEKTFAIIKPDAVKSLYSGAIIEIIERNKFSIIAMQKLWLTRSQVEKFYAIHKERSFFNEIVEYMSSSPVIVMALEKENAIQEWRDLMGATDPIKAGPGTIRRMFGTSIGTNATHGSDAKETAKEELNFFFPNI